MDLQTLKTATAHLRTLIPLRGEPLAFLYAAALPPDAKLITGERTCVIGLLALARKGQTVALHRDQYGCGGGGTYLGFCPPREGIAEFVSTGIPGVMEGEHYKQSPELFRASMDRNPIPPAPADYALFKPVSALAEGEEPLAITCVGLADELSALVFLANFARAEEAVLAPFSSGCGALVTRALLEAEKPEPRAILGIFDPSARPYLGPEELTFTAPRALWEEMLGNAEESFLKTPTWQRLKKRIEGLG
jgi:hypothetical protein